MRAFVAVALLAACVPRAQAQDRAHPYTLYIRDFSGDGIADIAYLEDRRDGFRHTFAYLEIYKNDGTPRWLAEPDTAKLKDGRWIWVDLAEYPALAHFRAPATD
jgi:hypothetical protein